MNTYRLMRRQVLIRENVKFNVTEPLGKGLLHAEI